MSEYASLMRRADTMRRYDDEPIRAEWWAGYMRGLRRAHHGERFGTEAEHQLWLAAAESTDPSRAALGRGYRAGLTLTMRDPDEEATNDKITISTAQLFCHGIADPAAPRGQGQRGSK